MECFKTTRETFKRYLTLWLSQKNKLWEIAYGCEREGISFLAYPLLGDINIIRSRKSCTIWLNNNGIYRLC